MTSSTAGHRAPAPPRAAHDLGTAAGPSTLADGDTASRDAGPGDTSAGASRTAAVVPSMYRSALGPTAFARLHPALQRFHALQGHVRLHGQVTTAPPAGIAARLLGRWLGTPLAARTGPVAFVLQAGPQEEHWTRHFPGRTMRSRLRLQADGHVVERLGPARLVFRLHESGGGLAMQLQSLHFFGVPCPGWLRPRVVAEERGTDAAAGAPGAEGARLHFDVRASVPGMGAVAGYRGWLDLATAEVLR